MMIDKDKIVSGLEHCRMSQEGCRECPYFGHRDDFSFGCNYSSLCSDALDLINALLLRPAAVQPVVNANLARAGWLGRESECCGVCGNNLRYSALYCDKCGTRVDRPDPVAARRKNL